MGYASYLYATRISSGHFGFRFGYYLNKKDKVSVSSVSGIQKLNASNELLHNSTIYGLGFGLSVFEFNFLQKMKSMAKLKN